MSNFLAYIFGKKECHGIIIIVINSAFRFLSKAYLPKVMNWSAFHRQEGRHKKRRPENMAFQQVPSFDSSSRGGGIRAKRPSGPVEEVRSDIVDYSHFVSLPLGVYPEIVDHLIRFQESVLDLAKQASKEKAVQDSTSTASGWGIERSIFVKPETFHLTVLMLKLWNDERVRAASEALQRCKSKVHEALEGRPVAIRVRGLECMRGSLAQAHVLNACVDEADKGNRLARACQVIIDEFVTAGLVLEADRKQALKLHATLMNTRHRDMDNGRSMTKRIPFDARQILSHYRSIDFGQHFLLEVHLSQRFSYGVNGYYACCGCIELPSITS